jgi:hypothetical protein
MKRLILAAAFSLVVSNAFARNDAIPKNPSPLDAQVRCASEAKRFYEKYLADRAESRKKNPPSWKETEGGYQSHYNRKLNRCLAWITSTTFHWYVTEKTKPGDVESNTTIFHSVYDVIEGVEFAWLWANARRYRADKGGVGKPMKSDFYGFVNTSSVVRETDRRSFKNYDEWLLLIEPLMRD